MALALTMGLDTLTTALDIPTMVAIGLIMADTGVLV